MSNNKDFKVKNGIKPTVYHEAVGTVVSGGVGYSLAGASYDSVSLDVSSQDIAPLGISFGDAGLKLYVAGGANDTIFQYALSTAFDLSTASYTSKSFSVVSQDNTPTGLAFNNTGSKMFVVGSQNDSVYQYSLSTAWDVSTASYDSVSLSVSSQDTGPSDLIFKPDGTKMYVSGDVNDSVYEYTLSTPFDLSTASYTSSLSVQGADGGLAFNSDGTKLFIVSNATSIVYEYALTNAYDVTTGSYTNVSFSVLSEGGNSTSMAFNLDGSKMYISNFSNDRVYQYSTALNTASLDLSTGSVFELTPTSDVQVTLSNPAASGTSSGATLLLSGGADTGYDLSNASYDSVSFSVTSQAPLPTCVKFDPTGTKMYVLCLTNGAVYQYSLSTAWDVSTASYDSKTVSVSTQDTAPLSVIFSEDGTKMYMSGSTNEAIYQYSLSTAWDVSTASYDSKSLSLSGQSTDPYEMALYNSGNNLLVLMNDSLYQYTLSTAYDISTASYDSIVSSFSAQDATMTGFEFYNNGTGLAMLGLANDRVYQYTLSTPYDVTTASYDSVSFSVAQDTQPHSVTFGKLGTKMFVMGLTNDTVYQYTVGTPATITYDPTIQWAVGTAPTSPAIGETDVVTFTTRDGGTSYSAALAIDGAQ